MWVPITVALIGFIGLLVNQLISLRRDNVKLRVEAEQEKVRLSLEVRKQWREQRISYYAAFLEQAQTLNLRMQGLGPTLTKGDKKLYPDQVEFFRDLDHSLSRSMATIDLLASKPARKAANDLYLELIYVEFYLLHSSERPTVEGIEELISSLRPIHANQHPVVLAAFRADLGTDDHELVAPATPTPSSGRTS